MIKMSPVLSAWGGWQLQHLGWEVIFVYYVDGSLKGFVRKPITPDGKFLVLRASFSCPVCKKQPIVVELEHTSDAWLWYLDNRVIQGNEDLHSHLRKTFFECTGCGVESHLGERDTGHLIRTINLAVMRIPAGTVWAEAALKAYLDAHREGREHFQHYFDSSGIHNEWITKFCSCERCLAHPVGKPADLARV